MSRNKIAILVLLLVLVLVGGFFYIRNVYARLDMADQAIGDAVAFHATQGSIQAEYTRCQDFIAQRQGDFGDFEYCTAFIEWVTAQKLLP